MAVDIKAVDILRCTIFFAGPDKGGGHFKALKNREHRSYKKNIVIPWLVSGLAKIIDFCG